jgi:hypothetical protein
MPLGVGCGICELAFHLLYNLPTHRQFTKRAQHLSLIHYPFEVTQLLISEVGLKKITTMISVLSTTGNYILQPALLDKHRNTLYWISSTNWWKTQLEFFQKLLDQNSSTFSSNNDKKRISHFQNIILYYRGEVVDLMRKKLREHESKLAQLLQTKDETATQYFSEHESLMSELETFAKQFKDFRQYFFQFIARVL